MNSESLVWNFFRERLDKIKIVNNTTKVQLINFKIYFGDFLSSIVDPFRCNIASFVTVWDILGQTKEVRRI